MARKQKFIILERNAAIAAPPREMDKIAARLKRAGEEYESWKKKNQ
jgi:hypothetical protein